MPLNKREVAALLSALQRYDYPACVWNGKGVVCLADTTAVERYIARGLASNKPTKVRNGLLSIVCWGWGGQPNRASKIAKAEKGITDKHVNAFIAYRKKFPEGDISALARLRLNQLRQMVFGTKVLAFMNLSNRAVRTGKFVAYCGRPACGNG